MASLTPYKNYLAGVSTGSLRMVLHVLTGLWLTPFTLRHMDRQEFAIFSLTLDVVGWLALLDLGITAGLRIQAARLVGLPQQDTVNRLASTAFLAQNLVVLAVLLVGGGLAAGFPYFFPIRPTLHHDAMAVMAITVLGAGISIGCQTFSALLVANQQMHVDNLLGLLMIVIRTVLTVVLLELGWGIYSLAVAHLAARVTTGGLAVLRVYRFFPELKIKYRLASWEVFRQIGGLGIWFSLGSLAGIIIHTLGSVVTAKVISVETVTVLVLTGRFYELSSGLVFLISENARPMIGQMFGQDRIEDSLKTYRLLFGVSTGLAVVVAFGVWAGNGCFVTKWVGDINYGGIWVDLAQAFMVIAALWNLPNRVVLSANLAVRGQSCVRIAEGLLNLGLTVWFAKRFGLIGIPLGSAVACLLTSMWMLPLLTSRMYKRSFASFLWGDASRVVLLMVMLLPVAYAARQMGISISGYVGAASGGIVTCLVGFILFWFLILDTTTRARVPLRKWYDRFCTRTFSILGFTRAG